MLNLVNNSSPVIAPHLSDKYKHLPDQKFLQPLLNNGFTINNTSGDTDSLGKRIYRLGRPDLKIGDDNIEIVAINSHNGQSSFMLTLGIYRFVCSNGLVVGKSFIEPKRTRHIGEQFYEKVEVNLNEILRETDKLVAAIETMKNTELNESQYRQFLEDSLKLRFTEDDKTKFTTYQSMFSSRDYHHGRVRRSQDSGMRLWEVFNRVQENLINGGFFYVKHKEGETTSKKARKLSGIDSKLDLNQGLFDLAMSVVA